MGLIRLYCDVVAMLEALYHRMILVVRVGQSPELMNYTDLPRKLKDYWLDSLRRKAKIFLKFIYLPDKTDYYQSTVYHRLRSSGNEDAWGVGKAMDALGVSPKRFDIGDIVTVQVYSSSPRTDTTITYSPTTKSLETVPMAGDGGALDQQWEVQHGVTEHGYSLRNMATRQFIFPGRNLSRSIADHLLGRATNKGTTIELIEIDPLDCGQSERNGSCFRISDYQWNFKKSRMGHTKSFELYSTTGGVAFIIHTVRNASDNDYIESVRHYTVNFKQCKPDSKCSRRGYSYSWCRYNKFNRYDWDYCSMEQGYTYHGVKCLQGICNPSMSLSAVPKLYFWCYTSKDLDWDYCSVQDPIVYRRALDAQLNQTIRGFPCLGPCQSNNRCVEAYSSQAFGENYCSLREGYSVGNKKCVDSCSRKKRSSYLYCNLEDGSWDYCSIERNKWKN